MPSSSATIHTYSAATGVPYGTVERMTQALKSADRWIHRGLPEQKVEYLAAGVVAFAAPTAVRAMEPVRLADRVVCNQVDQLPKPVLTGFCSRKEATFGLPEFRFPFTLIDFLIGAIERLAETPYDVLYELRRRLHDAAWQFSFCLDPFEAYIEWSEEAHRYRLRWFRPPGEQVTIHRGAPVVEWTARLPFDLLIAAARTWRDFIEAKQVSVPGQGTAITLSETNDAGPLPQRPAPKPTRQTQADNGSVSVNSPGCIPARARRQRQKRVEE